MIPADVLAAARVWLDANRPGTDHSGHSETALAFLVEWQYPGGLERFVEDLAQASAVS